ncbi:MAG: lipid II flippase MurJ [Verrucomicrobiae bacterium]|nr:lipid II flippase MurJ [Verrucomicrobiae bacterium]
MIGVEPGQERERSEKAWLIRNSALAGGLLLAGRAFSAVREMGVAYAFGVCAELDFYVMAFMGVTVMQMPLAGAMQVSLTPQFVRLFEKEGADKARELFQQVMIRFIAVLAGIVLLSALASGLILPCFSSFCSVGWRDLILPLFAVLAPASLSAGVATVGAGILNGRGDFLRPGCAAALNPLIGLGVLLAFYRNWGIYALSWAVLAGSVVELGVILGTLWRTGLFGGIRWMPLSAEARSVWRQFFFAVGSGLIMAQTAVVDQTMAALLGPGNVSSLSYGGRLPSVVLSVLMGGVSSVLLPYFARIATRDEIAPRRMLEWVCRRMFLLAAILSAAMILLSEPLTRLLYGRGRFLPADVATVSDITACLALQIPFYMVSVTGIRYLSAKGLNQWMLGISAVNLTINIAGDYLLMRWFGVAGIALNTAIVYLCASIMVWGVVFCLNSGMNEKRMENE